MRAAGKKIAFLVIFAVFGTWSLLSAIYCAWLTATPTPADRLRIVQIECYVWLACAFLSLVGFLAVIVVTVRSGHAEPDPEFTPII